jgi:DNA-binding MarR family transcriptional regulator
MSSTRRSPVKSSRRKAPGGELRTALALHAIWRNMRRMGEAGLGLDSLPPSEADVLGYIGESAGPSVTEVARALRMQPSNVSTAVRSLLERKLVERRVDPRDRRVARLYVTPYAAKTRRRIEGIWAETIAAALHEMPPEDARALRAAENALQFLAAKFTRGEGNG